MNNLTRRQLLKGAAGGIMLALVPSEFVLAAPLQKLLPSKPMQWPEMRDVLPERMALKYLRYAAQRINRGMCTSSAVGPSSCRARLHVLPEDLTFQVVRDDPEYFMFVQVVNCPECGYCNLVWMRADKDEIPDYLRPCAADHILSIPIEPLECEICRNGTVTPADPSIVSLDWSRHDSLRRVTCWRCHRVTAYYRPEGLRMHVPL